ATTTGTASARIEEVEDDALSYKNLEDDTTQAKSDADLLQQDGTKKLWVDVLSGNRNPANGLAMEYVAPKLV
ncbi:hypothetical protein A2U01_0108892, partial [Trifolium medium]|nr:hypothetical protein [Trifolium medium]